MAPSLAKTSARPLWLRIVLVAVQVVLAIVAGFFLMWPLSMAFDALRLSDYNTWSLVHGGFGTAWPVLAIASFALLGYVKWFHRVEDAPLLAAGALLGLVLQGLVRSPDPMDFDKAPLLLLVVACISAALLATVAKHGFLLAVVIGLPQWLDILTWLAWIPVFSWDGLEMLAFTLERSLPVPAAALAGAALADLVRRLRRRSALIAG